MGTKLFSVKSSEGLADRSVGAGGGLHGERATEDVEAALVVELAASGTSKSALAYLVATKTRMEATASLSLKLVNFVISPDK